MKDNSFDIPAIQFRILYKENGSFLGHDINDESINQIMFNQVDGLTIEQFLSEFKTKDFVFFPVIETTDLKRSTVTR